MLKIQEQQNKMNMNTKQNYKKTKGKNNISSKCQTLVF